MIHLYHGDGKGKTTAAMGLALRMAGRGRPVVIAQFLKGADSGERLALARLPQVTLLPVPEKLKFLFAMTEEERRQEARRAQELLAQAGQAAADPDCGLVVRRGERRAAPPGGPARSSGRRPGGGGPHRAGPGPGADRAGRLYHPFSKGKAPL